MQLLVLGGGEVWFCFCFLYFFPGLKYVDRPLKCLQVCIDLKGSDSLDRQEKGEVGKSEVDHDSKKSKPRKNKIVTVQTEGAGETVSSLVRKTKRVDIARPFEGKSWTPTDQPNHRWEKALVIQSFIDLRARQSHL